MIQRRFFFPFSSVSLTDQGPASSVEGILDHDANSESPDQSAHPYSQGNDGLLTESQNIADSFR